MLRSCLPVPVRLARGVFRSALALGSPRVLRSARGAILSACCRSPRPSCGAPLLACGGLLLAGGGLTLGCGTDRTAVGEPWATVASAPDRAMLAVHGTAADDVWIVGADAGRGPLVLHWNGADWQAPEVPARGDLWWVHALPGGPVLMGGESATILRYQQGELSRMPTPGLGKQLIFGVWASSPSDIYAVGAEQGRNGFVWHYDGDEWISLPLPSDIPLDENRDLPGFFKVAGASSEDVWIVGDRGVVLRGSAAEGFARVPAPSQARLFTVSAAGGEVSIVGGEGNGLQLQLGGDGLVADSPAEAGLLQGCVVGADGSRWVSGAGGAVYHQAAPGQSWESIPTGIPAQTLHAIWMDPAGGVWAVGGNALSTSLDEGVAIHRGRSVRPSEWLPPEVTPPSGCPEGAIDPAPEASIAGRWNEQMLGAIRRDLPAPTVHARNLFHTSVAMWDAWAAYDAGSRGYLVNEAASAEDVEEARRQAISYAAHRVLAHRYRQAVGGEISLSCFDAFMGVLGYDPAEEGAEGDSPRALGNRIGQAVIDAFAEDGANEAGGYADPDAFVSPTPLLVVDLPGTRATDPLQWQQLELSEAITQNGIVEGAGVRSYVGPHWRDVTPFALERPEGGGPYLDIGDPPTQLDDALVEAVVRVIRKTAELDISDGVQWDISPGGYGNNGLGADDGAGRPQNPITGQPYEPEPVLRGDFARVLAEFWADGPASETPPGHWNTLANAVSRDPRFQRRLFGEGEVLDPLAWDVHAYLALNGAVHDAAIAAWELKRTYLSARPITLIRYMGGRGQRSDPGLPSYDPEGLPLVEGLIELITEQSSAPGERHEALARYAGEIALWSWRGEPGDPEADIGGVGWIRALDWRPYQRSFFVTPAFPGYLSGHSTFSRAAAVVLDQLTGSPFFPGGLGTYSFEPGYLFFEYGPSEPLELQWATYYDASDQAGQSRLWGGIHITHDDFDGRRAGQRVGELAVAKARGYFDLD